MLSHSRRSGVVEYANIVQVAIFLVEIKAALGNDTNRFARTMARPLLVERLLRDKFDNDDSLHATQRRECEDGCRRHRQEARSDHEGLICPTTLAAAERHRGEDSL